MCNVLVARSNIMRLMGARVDGIIIKHDITNFTGHYPGMCIYYTVYHCSVIIMWSLLYHCSVIIMWSSCDHCYCISLCIYCILGIVHGRKVHKFHISQIWKHSSIFSCTFYPAFPSVKNIVNTHVMKWITTRYLHLYSHLFHLTL